MNTKKKLKSGLKNIIHYCCSIVSYLIYVISVEVAEAADRVGTSCGRISTGSISHSIPEGEPSAYITLYVVHTVCVSAFVHWCVRVHIKAVHRIMH